MAAPQPAGSVSSAAQHATPPFKYTRPPPNAFAFVTIPAIDVARAEAFYAAAFQWTFRTPPGSDVTIFNNGGQVMGRMRKVETPALSIGGEGREDGVVLYVLVEDVEVALARVVEAGGRVIKEKWVEGGHTELAEVRDTEGNCVGVLKWLM